MSFLAYASSCDPLASALHPFWRPDICSWLPRPLKEWERHRLFSKGFTPFRVRQGPLLSYTTVKGLLSDMVGAGLAFTLWWPESIAYASLYKTNVLHFENSRAFSII